MMNPVYVHENPGPFPAIKKSLRKKRDVYFRILGAKVLKFDGASGRGLWYRPSGDEYVWLLRSLGGRPLNDEGRLL